MAQQLYFIEQNLVKLDWFQLTEKLANAACSVMAKSKCAKLMPTLTGDEVRQSWREVDSLKQILESGYHLPISEYTDIYRGLKLVENGQTLEIDQLYGILQFLTVGDLLFKFCQDFEKRHESMRIFRANYSQHPKLKQKLLQSVDQELTLLDTASEDLLRIRREIRSFRSKIENQMSDLLHNPEISKYLQDDFFTIRYDRYVIPLRLDGHGRVAGKVWDTSASDKTLFFEPSIIATQNDQLAKLVIEEKLEVYKILRMLSESVAVESTSLESSYNALLHLDVQYAKAKLAKETNSIDVEIVDEPCLQMYSAQHPLLFLKDQNKAVSNDITLKEGQNTLIISGPNAGGKTVVLKKVGMMQRMAKAGLLLPMARNSKIFLYERVFLDLGDSQSIESGLSTFSSHLYHLKNITENATQHDLILLDELAVGTSLETGEALAQSIIEHLVGLNARTIVTTHFERLKLLATTNQLIRNASMLYDLTQQKPLYKLQLDVAGLSLGLDLAEKVGMPAAILLRAKNLLEERGQDLSAQLNLMEMQANAAKEYQKSQQLRLQLEGEIGRWQAEAQSLGAMRLSLKKELAEKYQNKFSKYEIEFFDLIKEVKSKLKELLNDKITDPELDLGRLQELSTRFSEQYKKSLGELEQEWQSKSYEIFDFSELVAGLPVYVCSLARDGVVTKVGQNSQEKIEVQCGVLKIWVALEDLRKK